MTNSLIFVTILFLSVVFRVEPILNPFELGPVPKEFAQKLSTVCVPRTGVTSDAINEVIDGKFTEEPKMKAYMTCVLLESKTMDDKGQIDPEVVPRLIPDEHKDKVRTSIKHCSDQIKDITSLEDKALGLYKCVYSYNPDAFLFF